MNDSAYGAIQYSCPNPLRTLKPLAKFGTNDTHQELEYAPLRLPTTTLDAQNDIHQSKVCCSNQWPLLQ